MKAAFRKHIALTLGSQIEIAVVHLTGAIDVESVDLFEKACQGPLSARPVVFNFEGLSFVGSSGLRTFLECLNNLTKVEGSDVRFCCVRNDFRQILAATPLISRPCYENELGAINSYHHFNTDVVTSPILNSQPSDFIESEEGAAPDVRNQDGDFSLEG